MQNRTARLIAAALATFLCALALGLGQPAETASSKIIQTALLVGALVVLVLVTLRGSSVPTRILVGLVLGGIAGLIYGPEASAIRPVGTAFIRLIKMVVVPLIFASLLVGVASLDIRRLGRIGGKTVIFYICYYTASVALGLFLANTLKPGGNLPEDVKSELMESYSESVDSAAKSAEERPGFVEILLPENPAESMVRGRMLQIIFFAIVMGVAISTLDKKKMQPVLRFFEAINDIMVKIVQFVIKLAPYGVFALIASVVGTFGVEILVSLINYSLVVIGGLFILAFSYPAIVWLFARYPYFKFWKAINPAQLIAFSTCSSSATLPVTMKCAEDNVGISKQISTFVLPLGATINMDGTALYQGVSALFIAQVYGMQLGIAEQLTVVFTATLASVGAAGAPAMGVLMLVMVLQQVGIPLEGIALIMGVERILDMFRTVVNVTGDLTCAAVIAHTEGELCPASGE